MRVMLGASGLALVAVLVVLFGRDGGGRWANPRVLPLPQAWALVAAGEYEIAIRTASPTEEGEALAGLNRHLGEEHVFPVSGFGMSPNGEVAAFYAYGAEVGVRVLHVSAWQEGLGWRTERFHLEIPRRGGATPVDHHRILLKCPGVDSPGARLVEFDAVSGGARSAGVPEGVGTVLVSHDAGRAAVGGWSDRDPILIIDLTHPGALVERSRTGSGVGRPIGWLRDGSLVATTSAGGRAEFRVLQEAETEGWHVSRTFNREQPEDTVYWSVSPDGAALIRSHYNNLSPVHFLVMVDSGDVREIVEFRGMCAERFFWVPVARRGQAK